MTRKKKKNSASDKSNDIESMMSNDVKETKKKPLTKARLTRLAKMVNEMKVKTKDLEKLEKQVLTAKEKINKLSMNTIPDFFDEMGLSKIALTDGTAVEIIRKYVAHIKEENKAEVYKWLRKNKHAALIKHDVTAKIKKGELKEYKSLVKDIKKLGISFTDKKSIHAGTLNAFVNEQMEEGVDLPEEFGVFPLRKTKLTN
jgi:hypothetical protein